MTEPIPDGPPPRPRLDGRASAFLGLGGLIGAILIFFWVLIMLDVVPNPLHHTADPIGKPAPTSSPGPAQLAKPARFAQERDCLLNVGTQAKPDMIMVGCTAGALEVIERIEGTVDFRQCEKLPEYRYYYFYDSDLGDSLDFVLCMRKRP